MLKVIQAYDILYSKIISHVFTSSSELLLIKLTLKLSALYGSAYYIYIRIWQKLNHEIMLLYGYSLINFIVSTLLKIRDTLWNTSKSFY